MKEIIEFKGKCVCVSVTTYEKANIGIRISIEDDTNWNEKIHISAFWLNEMIKQLQSAKAEIDKMDLDEWFREKSLLNDLTTDDRRKIK